MLRPDQAFVDERRAVLPDGDVAASQRLVFRVEADKGGELLLGVVKPLLRELLLLQQVVRLRFRKSLLDLLQLGVEPRLELDQLGRCSNQPRLIRSQRWMNE
jgi:hypothetical protein